MRVACILVLAVSGSALKAPALGDKPILKAHQLPDVPAAEPAPEEVEFSGFKGLWLEEVKEEAASIHAGKSEKRRSERSEHVPHSILWSGFTAFVAVGVFLEVTVLKSYEKDLSLTDAGHLLVFWVAMAAAFSAFVYLTSGASDVFVWLDGYVIEIMMSVDNLFLYIMLFSSFHAPGVARSKLLMFGVLGAIVCRLVMFASLHFLMHAAVIITKIFGIFIIYTAYKTVMFDDDEEEDFEDNIVVQTLKKCLPLTGEIDATGSLIIGGKATPMLLCTATLIFLDGILFAIDSVSAKTVMFDDLYLNLTSTGFACFTLRAMYYGLQAMADMFAYLKYGIGLILLIIGLKVMLPEYILISDGAYLVILVVILSTCIALSLLFPPPAEDDDAKSQVTADKGSVAGSKASSAKLLA